MTLRQVIGDILILLTAAFTAYLAVIMLRRIRTVVRKDSYVKIFRYELAACALFILLALDIRFGFLTGASGGALLICGRILRVLLILACAVLLFFFARVAAGSLIRSAGTARHALVLGLALEDGKPTRDLISRLDTAEKFIKENPEATLILTGGNPDAAGRTEAAVMRDLLLERGVPEDRMILEDKAVSTKDNFLNTAEMIDPAMPVVLITSSFHMDRAVRTAKAAGFTRILRLPAPSSALHFGANVMWEALLELNDLTLKKQ